MSEAVADEMARVGSRIRGRTARKWLTMLARVAHERVAVLDVLQGLLSRSVSGAQRMETCCPRSPREIVPGELFMSGEIAKSGETGRSYKLLEADGLEGLPAGAVAEAVVDVGCAG